MLISISGKFQFAETTIGEHLPARDSGSIREDVFLSGYRYAGMIRGGTVSKKDYSEFWQLSLLLQVT